MAATRVPTQLGELRRAVHRLTTCGSSRAQFQELNRDAQQLRQQLQAAGINPADLDAVMRGLRRARAGERVYDDPNALARSSRRRRSSG